MNAVDPIVRAFLLSAARALGANLGDELARHLGELARSSAPTTTLTVTQNDREAFLRGGPFAPFVADKVLRDSFARFNALPVEEQQAVLVTAASHQPSPHDVVHAVVAYMASRP